MENRFKDALDVLNFKLGATKKISIEKYSATIREALHQAHEQRWRPIDSAPKDKEILVFNGENAFPAMWREPEEYRDYGEEGGWCEARYDHGGMLYEGVDVVEKQPTHWMPLPPAPTAQEGGGDEL